jgi:VWFA-related protein
MLSEDMYMKKYVKKTMWLLCIAMFLIGAAIVSADDIADFSIEWLDTSSFPVNVIYYSTADENGEPAGSMWVPDDVTVYEGGSEHKPGDFGDDEHAPAYLSLIIDSSGSMEDSLQEVLKAARKLINQFDRQDKAEIVDFDSKVVTRRSFTDSKEEMLAALDEVQVGGGTALYDAIAAGFDHLRRRQGMKSILVLSDGSDENSTKYSLEALKKRIANEGVRVFTIALGQDVDTTTMTEIAEVSEGSFYHADTAEDVEGIYTEVITYLHSLHRMWYSTSQGMFDGSSREISIEYKPTGKTHTASYTAPESDVWEHALTAHPYDQVVVRMNPDGSYVSFLQHRAILTKNGKRLTNFYWEELYDGSLTQHFICGYVHRNYGSLYRYKPEEQSVESVNVNDVVSGAEGNFHNEWEWYPKAISPDETYLVLAADPEDGEYDYYFALYNRKENTVLWEQGLYQGEFDEPGPVTVAENGLSGIVQDDNLFVVEPNGDVRLSLMWEETGKRWQRMDMSADGRFCIGRERTGNMVWAYNTDGTLLWEKESEPNEKAGYVSISPNGTYFGYADNKGPHICGEDGTVLFELAEDEIYDLGVHDSGCGIDIANDGSFVYWIGSRMYYRLLED